MPEALQGATYFRTAEPISSSTDVLLINSEAMVLRRRCSCAKVASGSMELACVAGGCWLFNWVFHNPYCGLLFRCHCTWPWAGGWSRCNVHHVDGPRCPWCNVKHTALAGLAWAITDQFTVSMMLCSYIVVVGYQECMPGKHHRTASRGRHLARALVPMLTFLMLGFVMGLAFYLGTDYPCFLWIADNATECGWRHGYTEAQQSIAGA